MARGGDPTRTEEESAPARAPASIVGREALVVVFPVAKALPVPPGDEPFGREWLAGHGIDDPKASGRHCRITRRGGVFIEDLGSRNGTRVDGARVPPGESVALEDGAVIRIGRTLLVYRRHLLGPDAPSAPIGELVAPYGLRAVEKELEAIVARAPRNVLIEGDTGTGKELLARAIAQRLGRGGRRYAPINIAAVPAGVFDAQLFGYVAGAYSGAGAGSPGVVMEHDGGAVFLDEIGELHLELQPKLLRFLENREVLPVGSPRAKQADVVLIAATHQPLRQMVEQGRFRRDLLARLEEAVLRLPALNDRPEDIYAIAHALVASLGMPYEPREVEPDAVEHLLLHEWTGNVRELRAKLDQIARTDRPGALHAWAVDAVLGPAPMGKGPLTIERAREAVARNGNNLSAAARDLGVTIGKLRRRLGK